MNPDLFPCHGLRLPLIRLANRGLVLLPALALSLGVLGGCAGPEEPELTAPTAEAREALAATVAAPVRISYGADQFQFGDLRVPSGPGPHPVAVLIHGGCWTNFFGLELMNDMSDTLTGEGLATWNIEYRRIMDPGGGYPNTLTDVGMAVDILRDLAPIYDLDVGKIVTVGHSAGGQLAVWVGARHTLPASDPLRGADPLPLSAAVSLAGILNLAEYLDINICGEFVDDFMGGTPAQVPERYAEASPSELVPIGLRQVLVHGTADPIVPVAMSQEYRDAARDAGDHHVTLKKVHGGDHFDMITPTSPKWPQVNEQIIDSFDD